MATAIDAEKSQPASNIVSKRSKLTLPPELQQTIVDHFIASEYDSLSTEGEQASKATAATQFSDVMICISEVNSAYKSRVRLFLDRELEELGNGLRDKLHQALKAVHDRSIDPAAFKTLQDIWVPTAHGAFLESVDRRLSKQDLVKTNEEMQRKVSSLQKDKTEANREIDRLREEVEGLRAQIA